MGGASWTGGLHYLGNLFAALKSLEADRQPEIILLVSPNLSLHCGGKPGDCDHGYFEIGENSFIGCNAVVGAGGHPNR